MNSNTYILYIYIYVIMSGEIGVSNITQLKIIEDRCI